MALRRFGATVRCNRWAVSTLAFCIAGIAQPAFAQSADGLAAPAEQVPEPDAPQGERIAASTSITGTAGSDGLVTYTAADLARFAPRSALDMIGQIPDFEISGDDDERGLGTASQNVLINGQRVSGKSSDAEAALAAIPADRVQRIEVSEGARLGIPGLTGRVANVVVTGGATNGLTLRYRWEGRQRENLPTQITTGSISASGRLGGSDVTLSLSNNDGFRRGGAGLQRTIRGDGVLTDTSFERGVVSNDRPRLAGTLARRFADGSILNLNLAGELQWFRARSTNELTAIATGEKRDELIGDNDRERLIEVGGDYEFALGGGRLKLIALQSHERANNVSTAQLTPRTAGAIATGRRFARQSSEGESILRGEYSWGGGAWQIAAEGAYNFLDNRISLGRLQSDGTFADVALSNPEAFVDEWRSELLLTRALTLRPGLTLQLIGGGEYSRLQLAGTNGQVRQFIRPKGSATLAWTATPQLTVTATLARRVGQLSFFDFTDSVSLDNNTSTSGNANLVPEQSWRAEVQAAQSLGTLGSMTVSGFGERITDIVDSIPIGATGEGVGNLPSATRIGAQLSGTLLFDRIGVPGMRLNVSGRWQRSAVADPVTGITRRISNDTIYGWEFELRHDIPNSAFAWGATSGDDRSAPGYRLDQTSRYFFTRPYSEIYVEHKNVLGATVRLALRNVLLGEDNIKREVFVNRRDGPVAFREEQLRRIGPIGMIVISGNF